MPCGAGSGSAGVYTRKSSTGHQSLALWTELGAALLVLDAPAGGPAERGGALVLVALSCLADPAN